MAVSEKQLRMAISEIVTLRIKCQGPGCGKILEISIDADGLHGDTHMCKFCRQTWKISSNRDDTPIFNLVTALRQLSEIEDKVKIEFALPISD